MIGTNKTMISNFKQLEEIAAEDVGRNIQPLFEHCCGHLMSSILSVKNTPDPFIVILTGFFIPHGSPPNPETDGLTGSRILAAIIKKSIDLGERIACRISCDYLIVGGVSNWGAYAMICGLMLVDSEWKRVIRDIFSEKSEMEFLKFLIENKLAVDGVSGQCKMVVDGMPWERHQQKIKQLLNVPGG